MFSYFKKFRKFKKFYISSPWPLVAWSPDGLPRSENGQKPYEKQLFLRLNIKKTKAKSKLCRQNLRKTMVLAFLHQENQNKIKAVYPKPEKNIGICSPT